MRNLAQETTTVTIAQTGTLSGAFQIPQYATFVGVYVPDIDAANVTLQMALTSDGTYVDVLDETDGQAAVICASGSDPGFIDVTKFVRGIPATYYLKIKTSAAQNSAAVTFTVTFRG